MNDPVPSQGESEGTTMPELHVTTPPTVTQSFDVKMPDGSTGSFTPEPGGPADIPLKTASEAPTAASKPTKPQPTLATPPAPGVPSEAPKRAIDVMPPPMPVREAPPASQKRLVPISGAGWERELERSAASTGVDANLMRKIAGRESNNNPNARASTSTAGGIFQFLDSTWGGLAARYSQLGLTNKMDPNQQARLAPYYMKEIQENLHRKLGRAPDDAESYLGWFLGPVGAARALGASADTPVTQVVDYASMAANRAVFNKITTVGDLYNWSARKMAQTGERAKYTVDASSMAQKASSMGMQTGLGSTATRVPFTFEDKNKAAIEREKEAYSLVQAARESASQDWMVSNLLKSQGKQVYDPGFSVTPETLNRDDVKALPQNYLPYLSKSMSQQDFDFRMAQAKKDFEVEKRLAATPYGTAIRMAVGMADPAGIALAAVAPAGFGVNLARAGRTASLLAGVSDAAMGSFATEVPALMNKPGYEPEQALWAGLTGTAGYLALNRHMWAGRGHDAEMEGAIKGMYGVRKSIDDGTFGTQSAGAAQVAGYRDPVRADIEGVAGLQTEKSGSAWMDRFRFDMARHKNSENPLVAAVTDQLVQDTIGNRNTSKAVTIPVEARKRMMEEKQNVFWAREYEAAENDYRTRNNISYHEWEFQGGKDRFQREGAAAVRNEDPTVTFDPAVEKMASAWKRNAEQWRELAKNPGKERGETLRPLPGAEDWSDAPTYLPRYTNWGKFNELNGEFGNGLRKLLGEAIARKNPDLDADFAHQLGGYYYDRLARVEAGQEMTTMKALSGSDVEALRRDLTDYGLDSDAVNRALYQLDQNASESGGKSMTSRQKRRTLMDENFSLQLGGRNGSREVKVAELWEDNLHSIVHAYNKQMSQAVAFGQMRIENPNYRPPKIEKRKIKEKVAREVEEMIDVPPKEPTRKVARQVEEEVEVPPKEATRKVAREVEETIEHPGKPAEPFTTEERILLAAHTLKDERSKKVTIKDLMEALPDIPRKEFEDALFKMNADGTGHLSQYSDPKSFNRLKDWTINRGEDFHIFRPKAPSPTRTPNAPFKEIVKKIVYDEVPNPPTKEKRVKTVYDEVPNPSTKEKRIKTVYDEIEREVEEIIDNGTPKYIVDGIHSDGDWQKLEAQIRAHDVEVRHADQRKTVEGELKDLKFAFDAIRGVPNDIDRTRLGQAMRIVQNANFIRLMSQAGWSSVAEFGKSMGEFGVKHMMQTIPTFRDFMRDAKTGKLLRDELEDWEYHFTAGTDHLRGNGATWTGSDVASQLNDGASRSSRLDTIEAVSKRATRVVSSMSLAPLTTFQERWAMKAALAKFRDAADNPGKKVLSEKRMRVIGLDAEMQKRVLEEIKKHDSWVYGENGRKVRILGLEKWDPQVRSSFEHAVSTWTRRAIQQNDIGQMNAVMGSPFAKLMFQFRTFTIGAWSKQTLSSLHLHESNDLFGFMASMMFGSMAYAVQTNLNSLGMNEEDRKKVHDDRLSTRKIAQAGFQRAGASSLIPGMWDFGTGMIGLDPMFNTRATQQPTQGIMANPTLGLIDQIHGAARGLATSAYPDGHLTSGDVRRALTVLGNYPGFLHMVNAGSAYYPQQ